MQEFKQIEKAFKKARITDSKTLVVDEEFKNSLRERLYQHYLDNEKKGGFIMKIIKSITLNRKVALLASVVLVIIAVVAGVSVTKLGQKGEGGQKEVLIAANLAVADGDVEIRKEGEDRWSEGLQGDTLEQNDAIRTGAESRAVLELDNGDAVRLNSSSEVRLESLKPEAVVIEQISGESYCRIATSEQNTFTVKSQGVEAQALGTAYTFNSNNEEKQVVVHIFQSKVKMYVGEEEQEIPELKKVVVNTEEKTLDVQEMSEEEFKSEFASWNKQKDKESGFQCHEEEAPQVVISSPADGTSTEAESINVVGTVTDNSALKKIIVNENIYTSKDENGKGFDPSDGTFDLDIALVEGANEIRVKAYDIFWNASEEVVITVTRTVPEPPAPTNYFYVSSVSSPAAGKIYVKWVMSGYSAPSGFKVVAAQGKLPVYPGDKFTYMSDGSKREAYITGLSEGTYNVRVCIYNGSGACTMYTTNYKSVSVSGEVLGEVSSISLSGTGPNITWSTVGYSAKGFKVVWSKNPGPTYPLRDENDRYHYYSDPYRTTDTLDPFKGPGTYYARVCEYLGGKCGVYSNQISVAL